MSDKTYRLPEMLGGREMKAYHYRADPQSAGFYVEGEVVWVPLALLTEVTPPLPEEPTDLGYYFVNPDKGDGFLVERQLDGWQGRVFMWSWEQLHEHYPRLTLTRLIPAPVVEPVTLPWTCEDESEDLIQVDVSRASGAWRGRVYINAYMANILPDQADAMAAALTTAAARARALDAADAAERAS